MPRSSPENEDQEEGQQVCEQTTPEVSRQQLTNILVTFKCLIQILDSSINMFTFHNILKMYFLTTNEFYLSTKS